MSFSFFLFFSSLVGFFLLFFKKLYSLLILEFCMIFLIFNMFLSFGFGVVCYFFLFFSSILMVLDSVLGMSLLISSSRMTSFYFSYFNFF